MPDFSTQGPQKIVPPHKGKGCDGKCRTGIAQKKGLGLDKLRALEKDRSSGKKESRPEGEGLERAFSKEPLDRRLYSESGES